MITPRLETERLILREIRANDVKDIYEGWMRDEDVSRYMGWKASDDINETQKFVDFELGNIEKNNWNRWIIQLKDTGDIVGTCLLYYENDENAWDISYNLSKKYWGNGYMTEAMKSVMNYGANVLKISECVAMHAVENVASERVIKKLGFVYEKDMPFECNGGTIVTTGKFYRWKNNFGEG